MIDVGAEFWIGSSEDRMIEIRSKLCILFAGNKRVKGWTRIW